VPSCLDNKLDVESIPELYRGVSAPSLLLSNETDCGRSWFRERRSVPDRELLEFPAELVSPTESEERLMDGSKLPLARGSDIVEKVKEGLRRLVASPELPSLEASVPSSISFDRLEPSVDLLAAPFWLIG
jgi:hypothetical protein